MMRICNIAIWNRDNDVRRIDLEPGLNVITGASQTGKSALIEIIRYCLGSDELRVPAGPIAETVAYYGLLVEIGATRAFLGRPALEVGQQSTAQAQLEIGVDELPDAAHLGVTTNSDAVQHWIGRAIGIEENRFDPPEVATRRPLVAGLPHALIHCFQRQDEIASRQLLCHGQAEPFVAQAIRDTLPYFLGVTGPEQLRRAARLRDLRRSLATLEREREEAQSVLSAGLDEASGLLSQAADAGLLPTRERPTTVVEAIQLLAQVRDAPSPSSPLQAPGEEFRRLQQERRGLSDRLRAIREQRALASAVSQSGEAAKSESVEQIVRLQSLELLPKGDDPPRCPICDQRLERPVPEVEQLRTSLEDLERQIGAVERDRPGLVAITDDLDQQAAELASALEANRAALDALAQSAEAVAAYQGQLELGAFVRGRIDHYLDRALTATEGRVKALDEEEARLRAEISELERELDPARVRDAATSALIGIGRPMTAMAQRLGLEHAESGVRVDLGRLTVVADTADGPIYMDTGIGSGKNWVGYHLSTVLSLQQHFIQHSRPVPSFLVLDQPTQVFFPQEQTDAEIPDEDRADAVAQFELMRDVVADLDEALQILVLDHADFTEGWFQDAVRERWRDGRALIPDAWLT